MITIVGVILAGGQSRRMGRDKAFVDLDGKPLLQHAIETIAPQIGGVGRGISNPDHPGGLALAGGPNHLRLIGFGFPTLADHPGVGGPVAALPTALAWAMAMGAKWLAVQPLDMPHLPSDWIARLSQPAADCPVLLGPAERPDPAVGLWPVSCRPALLDWLPAHVNPSFKAVAEALGADYAEIGLADLQRMNMNRESDLKLPSSGK